jgi:hypothetical protein
LFFGGGASALHGASDRDERTMPEPTAKSKTSDMPSSASAVFRKPEPITWLSCSAEPADAPVSQPVPGDQSLGGCSLTRTSRGLPALGADAIAMGAPFSAPGSRSSTYCPPVV